MNIVTESPASVVDKLNEEIDRRGEPLASIIKAEDDLWDVSLMKFIYEITRNSLQDNLKQLNFQGLLNVDGGGVPQDARVRIEQLFSRVANGLGEPRDLKEELDRWDLFPEYEDKFYSLFKRK